MKACPQCSAVLADDALFCSACGVPQSGTAAGPGQSWPYPPPGAGGGFPAPGGYGYGGAPAGTNGKAIAALVLGILWLWGIGSILALIFGYGARGEIRRSGGRQSGDGLAVAGIVLGWVGVVGMIISIVAIIAITASAPSPY